MRTVLFLIAVLCPSFVVLAQFNGAPDLISHQGQLADTNGDPVADGNYNMLFGLYREPVGGTPIWTENHNGGNIVSTVNGIFHVQLGSITSLAEVPVDSLLYLGISVNGEAEMSPRTPLTAVPFALSLRNMRVIPESDTLGPNMIGGWSGNSVTPTVESATIAGGGDPDDGLFARPNSVEASGGTIGGGLGNTTTGLNGTVAGGRFNTAGAGLDAAVGGGRSNEAVGALSTVPGGLGNYAGGTASFAAGSGATVRDEDDGSFVWSDNAFASTMESTGDNQFLIQAAGGVGIGTNSPENNAQLHVEHGFRDTNDWGIVISNNWETNWRGGIRLSNDGYLDLTNNADNDGPNFARLNSDGNWAAVSDRRRKTDIEPASGLLEAALQLEPVTFRFKNQEETSERSLGMIAQDVQEVVPSLVTEGDVYTLNYAGLSVVAVGAIQELHQRNLEQEKRIAELEARLAAQHARLAELEALVGELVEEDSGADPLSAR